MFSITIITTILFIRYVSVKKIIKMLVVGLLIVHSSSVVHLEYLRYTILFRNYMNKSNINMDDLLCCGLRFAVAKI